MEKLDSHLTGNLFRFIDLKTTETISNLKFT